MSEMGPGNPYSKSPAGSTGGPPREAGAEVERTFACGGNGGGAVKVCLDGMGIGADVVAIVGGKVAFVSSLRSDGCDRSEYMVAVTAAPAPAPAAANIAMVVLDILEI